MSARSEPVIEAKQQTCPPVAEMRIDGEKRQAWSTDGRGVVLYAQGKADQRKESSRSKFLANFGASRNHQAGSASSQSQG